MASGKRTSGPGGGEAGPSTAFVVGVGASAGGLEALEKLLSQVPADGGLAVVVIQHLNPTHPTLLVELLARHTRLEVAHPRDGSPPEPGHVYVIAPRTLLTLEHGLLRVAASAESAAADPIDTFLCSLAEDRGERAIGVLLSGSGHDGIVGLRAIKERGGLTLAQSPETARHDSMPKSAIEAGLVDHVLRVEEMPARLLEHVGYLSSLAAPSTEALDAQLAKALGAVCAVLQERTGHDFSRYKEGTLLRRIRRRLQLRHLGTAEDYLKLLQGDAAEAEALLKDLLIGVTQFFRDPEAFQALAQLVLPRAVQGKSADAPIRIWVPGCASGEEAYTIAILVREHLERLEARRLVQIFATDLDAQMLTEARRGSYREEIAEHVSPERLARFFVREGNAYHAAKELREMCVFSQHSLVRDPPFSHLDLISCRNVLIYLGAELQRKLVPLFHYALRPGGFLFLGPSEGVAGSAELFETADKRHRIFQRKEPVTRPVVEFPLAGRGPPLPPSPAAFRAWAGHGVAATPQEKIAAAFERTLREEYTFPSAIVDERGDALFVAGPISRYLQLPAGPATIPNLLEAFPGNLRLAFRSALRAASERRNRVVREDVPVDIEDTARHVRLIVRPAPGVEPAAGLYLVVLQEGAPPGGAEPVEAAALEAAEPVLEQLEAELRATRAELKSTVEELESANEELKSSNEELISTNEELQSANEEMQTSKEELQSLNEELETINAELHHKVEDLATANGDLRNLFASTEIATIFLDGELRVARFTPAATELLRLIETDVGRPIGDLAPRFDGQDLVRDARAVLATLKPLQRQVRAVDRDSRYILRILPYRTVENVIAGVVITFADVTELKRAEDAFRQSEERFRLLVEGVKDHAIFMLAPDGTVASWNPGAERLKGYRAEEIVGQHFSRFYPPEDVRAGKPWRELSETAAEGRFEDEGWRLRKDGTRFWANVVVTALRDPTGHLHGFAKVTRDFSERWRHEEALRESEERLRRAQEIAHLGSWELDLERNSLSWSDEVYRIFGLVPQQFGATYQAFLEAVHPDDRAAVDSAYSDSLREGSDGYEIEHRVVRKPTGEVRVVHEKCEHIRDPSGRILRSIGMVHDVTERKRAEAGLERSRQGLSRLADASLSVMRRTELQDMLQAVSEATLALTGARFATCGHGYVNGQFLVGGDARAPGAPSCPPGKMFLMEKGGVHMDMVEGADAIRLSDGELRAHARWWGLPEGHVPMRGLLGARMKGSDGRTSGLILVTDKEQGDFTLDDESLLRQLATMASLALQHVAARIALEEADRSKNQFLAMLSHELRNPLAPIRNSLHILDRAAPGSEQARRAQKIIDRQVGHLTRLVDDLLDVTRISRGKVQLQRERLDLCDVLRRSVEDHRSWFTQNGVELRCALPDRPIWIDGDRTRVAQVIGNLLQNSARFTEPSGSATVSIEESASLGQAIARVRDTGIGIAPEVLPRLFEPFAQADTTLDRSKGGLGLGLALVKGLVEMHGGTVSAESQGLGKGAEFTLRFPLATEAGAPETAPARGSLEGRSRRVLVIEDNLDAAESLREVLELAGHAVEVALSGAEGIEKARAFRPDVVLCDIGLPGMNGYEVARAMRADPALRGVTLVALTGYAAPEDMAKTREAGFDLHLAKPPSAEKLEEALAVGGGRSA